LPLIEDISNKVPCYTLEFDRSSEAVALLEKLQVPRHNL